jgi:hypothetical protein
MEYTNTCFELIFGIKKLIQMLHSCKYFQKDCHCIYNIYISLSELDEVEIMYPDDHMISSLICTHIELQGHQPKENGVERDLTDKELGMCPLDNQVI